MDSITLFAVGGLVGALLYGLQGYYEAKKEGESFSFKKFIQTVIVGIITGAGLVVVASGTIDPEANGLITIILGLLTGYGVDSARNTAGVKA